MAVQQYGVINDPDLNAANKITIEQDTSEYSAGVVAYADEGVMMELTANWLSPFIDDNAGAFAPKVGGMVQSTQGITSVNELNSQQVWNGNEPLRFSLPINFIAYSDPANEVHRAMQALETMTSPQVNNLLPFGDVPDAVTINIGGILTIPNCRITTTPIDLSAPKTTDGFLSYATMQLEVESLSMSNRTHIEGHWQR